MPSALASLYHLASIARTDFRCERLSTLVDMAGRSQLGRYRPKAHLPAFGLATS